MMTATGPDATLPPWPGPPTDTAVPGEQTVAVLSAISNFLFIPYYPFWSLTIITIDIFVIWAIAAHGGELRDQRA
jgi:hypothetical protein